MQLQFDRKIIYVTNIVFNNPYILINFDME